LRYIDCDVEPGITYEYRIRVRVFNPNFGNEKAVTNPEFAKREILLGPWLQIAAPPVPPEAYLYAYDPAKYREDVDKAHKGNRMLLNLLQAKDNQAVVEVQTWMEGVKLSADTKQEPVGGWVVAEMPVGRGEFVGKKQFVKLPLWDSAKMEYQLRELPAEVLKARPGQIRPKEQPHGWLVDFSSRDVLVDFEGGRVKAPKPGGGTIDEDAAVELLIIRSDGTAVVRSSAVDMDDRERRERNQVWDNWLKSAEQRKLTPVGPGEPGGPGGPGPGRPGGGP